MYNSTYERNNSRSIKPLFSGPAPNRSTMDTGRNMKTSPANTSLTVHGNINKQTHINQNVMNNRSSKTQTQRDTTDSEKYDIGVEKPEINKKSRNVIETSTPLSKHVSWADMVRSSSAKEN